MRKLKNVYKPLNKYGPNHCPQISSVESAGCKKI